jgi:hypothetical protein
MASVQRILRFMFSGCYKWMLGDLVVHAAAVGWENESTSTSRER